MIAEAIQNVERAKAELHRAVRDTYPVGIKCKYWRSPRVAPAVVRVVSHTESTRIAVRNRSTGKVYKVDATSPRIRPLRRRTAE